MADFESSDPPNPPPVGAASASERLSQVTFPHAVRGYERGAVDDFVREVQALVAQLEAGQTREGAVQKALDDVGVETAGILQRAHVAADQLASSSRIDADQRVQRAEAEADQIRREAYEYSQQVVVDTRVLWEQRQRLIEDIRALADTVLTTADDAMERLELPEGIADAPDSDPESSTAETAAVGPVGVPAPEAVEPPPEDTGAWEVDEVEAEPPATDETASYVVTESNDPYPPGAYEEQAPASEEPAPATEEPPPADSVPAEEERDHTVELEALPGGGSEAGEERPARAPERGWDRERD